MNRYVSAFKRMNNALVPISKKYNRKKIWFIIDALFANIRYGITPNQYIGFGFYKYNAVQRRCFYTARHQYRYDHKLNDPKYRDVFWNKNQFNNVFKDFVVRDWLYAPDTDPAAIDKFVNAHKKVIVKPNSLSSGTGIHLYDEEKDTFEQLQKNSCMLEAFIVQHPAISALNPSSVNSVRVYTMLDQKGDIHFISALLRVGGTGATVDNYHSGGIGYPIDIESGVISGAGTDIMGRRFLFHPGTGAKVVGFAIPNWEACKSFITRAAEMIPTARLIAWDVAVLEDGFDMIEGNYDGDSGFMQSVAQEGKRAEIMSYK